MKGYYTSIVPGVHLSMGIEELPRNDQWNLCHHLMQQIGITEALYKTLQLFPAQREALDKLIAQTVKNYIDNGRE